MFKAGDKVRCLVSEHGNETVGRIYTVVKTPNGSAMNESKGRFWVEVDDRGWTNCYRRECFELVKYEPEFSPYQTWERNYVQNL